MSNIDNLNYAVKLRHDENFTESINVLTEIIKSSPDEIWAYLQLAENYRIIGDHLNLDNTLSNAYKNFNNNFFVCKEYSRNLILHGDYTSADNLLKSLKPDNNEIEDYLFLRLAILFKKRNYTEITLLLNFYKNNIDPTLYYFYNHLLDFNGNTNINHINLNKFFFFLDSLIKLNIIDLNYQIDTNYLISKDDCHKDINIEKIPLLITRAIRQNEPLSIIRISDGEGCLYAFLNFKDAPNNMSNKVQINYIGGYFWQRWFNRNILEADIDKLQHINGLFKKAICNSDVLSKPNFKNIKYDSYLSYHGKIIASKIGLLSNNYIYKNETLSEDLLEFTDFFEFLFSSNITISLITCHENFGNTLESCGVKINNKIIIPPHFAYASNYGYKISDISHFDYFNDVINLIKNDCDLYLISAGFLGKIYCDKVKELGGRALDIGILGDIFSGFQTRKSTYNKFLLKQILKPKNL